MYYRGAAAAIVVYDITRASSFKTLKHWVEELKTKGPKDIAIAIAGNKADLHASRVRNPQHTVFRIPSLTYFQSTARGTAVIGGGPGNGYCVCRRDRRAVSGDQRQRRHQCARYICEAE